MRNFCAYNKQDTGFLQDKKVGSSAVSPQRSALGMKGRVKDYVGRRIRPVSFNFGISLTADCCRLAAYKK
jgi:hypothetical protein